MKKQSTTTLPEELTAESEQLITLFELVAERGLVNADSVEQLAGRLGDEVQLDDIGRKCVTRATARRLVDDRRAREARLAEESQRRLEEAKKRPKVRSGGIPVPAGAGIGDALAILKAAETDNRDWLYGSGEFTGGRR